MSRNYFAAPIVEVIVKFQEYAISSPELATHVFQIEPLSFEVEHNGITIADKFKVELRGRDFPFDPRTVRNAAIQLYFGAGTEPGQRVIPRNPPSLDHDPSAIQDHTLMIVGNVDEPERGFSADSDVVSWEGRDNMGVLLEEPYSGGRVALDREIADVVESILATSPAAAGLQVVKGVGYEPVVLNRRRPSHLKRGRSPKKSSKGRKRKVRVEKLWDLIFDLVTQSGLVVFTEYDRVVIAARSAIFTTPENTPQLVLGENILDLKVRRRYGSQETPNIEVVSVNPDTKQTIRGRWPDPARPMSVSGVTSLRKITIERHIVPGLTSPEAAKAKARDIFEGKARQEIELELVTEELTFDGTTDITKVRSGSPLFVGAVSNIDLPEEFTRAELIRAMVAIGYQGAVATAYADTLDAQRIFGSPYYTRKAVHRYNTDDGYALTMNVANFIEPIAGD